MKFVVMNAYFSTAIGKPIIPKTKLSDSSLSIACLLYTSYRIRLLQLRDRLPVFSNGYCMEDIVGVVCGGRGLSRGFKLMFVFCIIVSKSVCDLYCNWSLSMLFGCVVWCLYISYCSAVLSFRPLGK